MRQSRDFVELPGGGYYISADGMGGIGMCVIFVAAASGLIGLVVGLILGRLI